MKLSIFLKRLYDLEQQIADLYGWYTGLFTEVPGAAEFFEKMKDDELKHRDIVDFERRIVLGSGESGGELAVDHLEIQSLAERIKLHMEADAPDIEAALEFSRDVEHSAAESHFKIAIAGVKPEIKRLIENLTRFDRAHREQIENYASSLRGTSR